MTRTVGAAIGAVIFVLFLSVIATRIVRPASAMPVAAGVTVDVRP